MLFYILCIEKYKPFPDHTEIIHPHIDISPPSALVQWHVPPNYTHPTYTYSLKLFLL